jgi:hypothetical protein
MKVGLRPHLELTLLAGITTARASNISLGAMEIKNYKLGISTAARHRDAPDFQCDRATREILN